MSKFEKIKSVFNCKYCSKLLNDPISLPCGESVCHSHQAEIIQNACKFCHDKHSKENEFNANKTLHELLKLEINSFLTPETKECNEVVTEAKFYVKIIDQIKNDPTNFAYEHFQEIKRQVDIRRERLKLKIDDYSNDVIKKIDRAYQELNDLTEKVKLITTDIEESEKVLNKLIDEFDISEMDHTKSKNIEIRVKKIIPKFRDVINEYKESLFDNKDYKFKFYPIKIDNTFGRFIISERNELKESKILSENDSVCKKIMGQKNESWELIYRASTDGFGSRDFHAKCDGFKKTLTIIEKTGNQICWGLTDIPWCSSGEYIYDKNILFCDFTDSHNNYPSKYIYCNENYGPTFATFGSVDICISDYPNITNSFVNTHGKRENIKIKEIEVYTLKI